MNEVTYTLEWDSDPAPLQEAMALAGRDLFKGKAWVLLVFHVVLGMLTALGGVGIAFMISIFGFGETDPGFVFFFFGAAAGVGVFIAYQRWPLSAYAKGASQSAYGRGKQRAMADATGITFANSVTEWRTDWTGVSCVIEGKKGIALGISGIAFSLPRAAFDGNTAQSEACAQMQAWHSAALSEGASHGP